MRKRLFFAINLDKKSIAALERLVPNVEAPFRNGGTEIRFVPKEEWHVTITFLGDQDDARLTDIIAAAKKVTDEFGPQEAELESAVYGPKQGGHSKMIWAALARESSSRLGELKTFLDDALLDRGVSFSRERRPFSGHVTLARFKGENDDHLMPTLDLPIGIVFEATSIDLMESELGRSGPQYDVIQRFSLSGER